MSRSRLTSIVLMGAFVAFSVGLKRQLIGRQSLMPNGYRVGATARDFTLPDLQGHAVSLRDVAARNDLTLVTFWATWCLPCRLEMPALADVWKRQHDHGVAILAVNTDGDATAARTFVEEHSLSFPVLLGDADVQRQYGIQALPTSMLVDRNATIRWIRVGVAGDLAAAVATELKNAHRRNADDSNRPTDLVHGASDG
jgi:peroxiredoxin